MPNIKVCMIVLQNYYHDGRVRRYAEALADNGVSVDVLCVQESQPSLDKTHRNIRVLRIPLHRATGGAIEYLLEYGAALFWFTVWLTALFFRRRYDIIHIHNMPNVLVISALLPKLFGAKVILDVHDPMPEFFMSKFHASSQHILVRLLCIEEKFSIFFSDAVIAANELFKQRLVQRGAKPENITVVNNVADPNIFDRERYQAAHQEEKKNFTLLYHGTVAPRYGLDIPIRALPLLIDKIPNICLRIIGIDNPNTHELALLAKQLGVSSYVDFKPLLPLTQIPGEIMQADIGIYTAIPDEYMKLCMPVKVLEYAIMGLPVVAARFPVLETLFSDSGLMFFEPGNVEQFAQNVLKSYHHPEQRQQLVHHADQLFVRQYSWHHERAKYFTLLDQVIIQKKRAQR